MKYSVDQQKIVCNSDMEYVGCYDSENSEDLKLVRGMFNGFIIEVFVAIFIFVVAVAI